MGKVIQFPDDLSNEVSPKSVLKSALEKDLEGVIVIGYTQDGDGYFSFSVRDEGLLVLILERVKLKVLMGDDDEEVS